jgi:hypothetical protein
MLPVAAGMQFLTNAFLLPYLVYRSPEDPAKLPVYADELDGPARACESPLLGPLFALVGSGAIAWGFVGRPEYGDLATRWASLCTLLGGDRLGTSFVVDLVLFACFQGWLVDDDLRRRGVEPSDAGALGAVAKFVPFVGMCAYLALRPPLPERPAASADQ